MLYWIYGITSTCIFIVFFPLLLLLALSKSKWRFRLAERFGLYGQALKQGSDAEFTFWVHASSVGEIQAARALIGALCLNNFRPRFIVTVMTEQGYKVAQRHFSENIVVLMAPLDVGLIVHKALRQIKPDVYICLETELWPAILLACKHAGIKMALLNGRISEHSLQGYNKISWLMSPVVRCFKEVGVISDQDGRRYQHLGVDKSRIRVTGNSKYDLEVEYDTTLRKYYQQMFGCDDYTSVFICGSTRSGEEKILLKVYQQLRHREGGKLLWILAPRHLERLAEIEILLQQEGIRYNLFSSVKKKSCQHNVVLVDVMGELAQLYSIGDYIFCGGSLVDCGGHNVMEAAYWGKPVYFGPYTKDFRDAVELLETGGCGYSVSSERELTDVILHHMEHPQEYDQACRRAVTVSANQHGAAKRQADIILDLLKPAQAGK